jgi:peptidoglycan/xylan/chitin deacetylase (PgdA/CDA1 family)
VTNDNEGILVKIFSSLYFTTSSAQTKRNMNITGILMKRLFIILFLNFLFSNADAQTKMSFTFSHGAIVRGDSTKKEVALVFTGDEFADGLPTIIETLKKQNVHGAFFFTGRFYRNALFQPYLLQLYKNGNYLSLHSNGHLLYCDWNKRDSLFVTEDSFATDIVKNIEAVRALNIEIPQHKFFIPPYEWWNDSIAQWANAIGWQLINYTPGLITAADYTYPGMNNYRSSDTLIKSLKQFETNNVSGLNGFIIIIHAGTDPRRKYKLYSRLDELIDYLKKKGYQFKRVDELLKTK